MNGINKLFSAVSKAIRGSREYRSMSTRLNNQATSVLHTLVAFSMVGSSFGGILPAQRAIQTSSERSSTELVINPTDDRAPNGPALEMPVIERQTPRTGVRPQIDLNDKTRLSPGIPRIKQAKSDPQFKSKSIMFIENVGQFDPRAAFVVRGSKGSVNISSDAIWITTLEQSQEMTQTDVTQEAPEGPQPTPEPGIMASRGLKPPTRSSNLRIGFQDANPAPKMEGFDRLDTKVSFFIGNDPEQWRSDVPVWGGVRYVDLYPGVDLEISSAEDEWTWSFVVRDESRFMNEFSGKDGSKAIRLRIGGAQKLERSDTNLNIQTEISNLILPLPAIEKPEKAQSAESIRALKEAIQVSGDEIIIPLSEDPSSSGLTDSYTSSLESLFLSATYSKGGKSGLMSPPSIGRQQSGGISMLFYSTYIGGSQFDGGMGVAANASGEAYLAACTSSSDYPAQEGIYPFGGVSDLAVTKFSADGKVAIYSTFIGGDESDCVDRDGGIAVGEDGSAFVSNDTWSTDFPTTANAYDQSVQPGCTETLVCNDAYVLKLNPTGTNLDYSSVIGGSKQDYGGGMALEAPAFVYITGSTRSNDYPTTVGAYDRSFNGDIDDAFIAKFNLLASGASSLIYSTFVGGSGRDQGSGIDVLGGMAYVSGQTLSPNFPTLNAYDSELNGEGVGDDDAYDAFVLELSQNASALVYSTYLGGSEDEKYESAIAVDNNGSAYVTGRTESGDFPTYLAYDASFNGYIDVFVTKFALNGSSLEYSTYLGGSYGDFCYAITLDSTGAAYLTGTTLSNDFPTTEGALDREMETYEAWVTKMEPDGSELAYSTFLGGTSTDDGIDLALDPAWTVYVTGGTVSDDFPLSADPFDGSYNGGVDGFLTNFGTGVYNSEFFEGMAASKCGTKSGSPDGRECPNTYSQKYGGDPIHTGIGGFDFSAGNLSIPTAAGQLVFQMSYSSQTTDIFTKTMGFGWTHNHDTYLIFPDDPGGEENSVFFKAHSLNRYRFYNHLDVEYIPDYGVPYSLERIPGPPVTYELTDKSQRVYTFDENGKLLLWTNEQGHSWSYTYDGSGKLERIEDEGGTRYLDLDYDGQGRLETVSDPFDRQISFDYDVAGDLTTFTDVLSRNWNFTYDGQHRLRLVTNPAGKAVVHNEYDAQGRAYQQFDISGNKVLGIGFQTDGTSVITDSLGITQTHFYDSRKTVTQEADPLGETKDNTYDVNFRPTSIRDENQNTVQMAWSKVQQNLEVVIDAEENRTDLGYDELNNLVSVIDPRDFLTTYEYSGTLMLSNTDALSNTSHYTYTTAADYPQPAGLLKEVTDPLGHLTSFTYNEFGQRLSTSDSNGTTTYSYDELGRLERVTYPSDPLGPPARSDWTCYDEADRVIRTVANASGDGGAPSTDPCDAGNYQPSATPGYDRITTIVYDLNDIVIARIDPKGRITRTYYDANNRPVVVVQNLVGQSIETPTPPEYDPDYPDQNIRTESVYDLNGNVIAAIDPLGRITRAYFDELNRPATVTVNLVGQAIEEPQPPAYNPAYPDQNLSTQNVYDPAGNVIATIDPLAKVTRTYYDGSNRLVSVVQNLTGQAIENPDPPIFNPSFPDQNVRSDSVYDESGNVIATIDPLSVTVRTYYDAINRPETVIQNLYNQTIGDPAPARNPEDPIHNLRSDYVYDETGNMIATVDPAGRVTRTYFDELNRPVTVTVNLVGQAIEVPIPPAYDPQYPDRNVKTETYYDTAGKVIATKDALGRITRTYYDTFYRPSVVVRNLVGQTIENPSPPSYNPDYPDQNFRTETIYGPDGEVIATKSNDGRVSRIYYDALDRQRYVVQNLQGQTIENPDPPVFNPSYPDQNVLTESIYDASGAVVKIIDTLGHVTYTCYDGANRTVKTILNPSVGDPCSAYSPDPDNDQDVTTTFSYDAAGNLLTQTDPNGKETEFIYDGVYRLSIETDPLSHSVHYAYDGNGNRIAFTDAEGTVTRFEYDDLSRLATVIENYLPAMQPDQETNVTTSYTYDVVGNRKSIVDANSHTTQFNYDLLSRLTEEIDANQESTFHGYDAIGNQVTLLDANGALTQFTYDGLYRLTNIDYPAPDADVNYTYDALGNRLSMTDGVGQTQWSYDALNRTIAVTDPYSNTVGYGYDGTGNRTAITYPDSKSVDYNFDDAGRLHLTTAWDYLTTTYSYDKAGRLQNVVLPNAVNTSYTYDDAGRLSALAHTRNGQNLLSYAYGYDANGNRTSAIENGIQPQSDIIFVDGFERGNLTAWSQSVTDGEDLRADPSAALIGSYGLLAEIDDNNTIYVVDDSPNYETTYEARFYFDPNSIGMTNGDALTVFQALNGAENPAAEVELGFVNGYYQIRAPILEDSGNPTATDWVVISDELHPIEISWKAASAWDAYDGSLTLYIDGEPKISLTGMDNFEQTIESARLGAVSGVDEGTRGNLYFDSFDSQGSGLIGPDPNGPVPQTFVDDFETGNYEAWSSAVTYGEYPRVEEFAAINGELGLSIFIYTNDSAYLVHDFSSSDEYHARFYFDPHGIAMVNGDQHTILQLENEQGSVTARLELSFINGYYMVRGVAIQDSGQPVNGDWITISDDHHAIEIGWKGASSPGVNDGWLRLDLDGEEKYTQTGIDNDTLRSASIKMGAVAGLDDGTRGTYYFDTFEARYASAIGLFPNGAIPDIFEDDFESGNYLAWSSAVTYEGSPYLADFAAINGANGLGFYIYTDVSHYLVHDFSSSDEYHARFYFDPNGIEMAEGDQHTILQLENEQGSVTAQIELSYQSGSYMVRGVAIQDGGQPINGNWIALSDNPHAIEIGWKGASLPGVNDGWLRLDLDGEEKYTLTGIDNDTLRSASIKMGAVAGLDEGTLGEYYFDIFEARYDSVIGLFPFDIFEDDFESGNLLAWTTVLTDGGDLRADSSAALIGSYGLLAEIDDDNDLYVEDDSPILEKTYEARFYFDPNSIGMANRDELTIFQALNMLESPTADVKMGFINGYYYIEASILVYSGYSIVSSWVVITDEPHSIEISWKAATEEGGFYDGSLTVYIDGEPKIALTGIENFWQEIESVKLGAVSSVDEGTRGNLYFDSFDSQGSGLIGPDPNGPVPQTFVDDFETGNYEAWSSAVTYGEYPRVEESAAINGALGLSFFIYTNDSAYLVHNFSEAAEYHARFYFDPNGIAMASGDQHTILQIENGQGSVAARLELSYQSGFYMVRGVAIQDGGQPVNGAWITLSDDRHAIEIGWKGASLPGVNDGWLRLVLDGEEKYTLTGVDNDTLRSASIKMGAVAGLDDGTRGEYYFDTFEARYASGIGLLPNGATPDFFEDGFEAGNYLLWTSVFTEGGSLDVNSQAAINGALGLHTTISTTNNVYLEHDFYTEAEYHARFYFDPNGIGMAIGDQHTILQLENGQGSAAARVDLGYQDGYYVIRGVVLPDEGQAIEKPWIQIADDLHALEIGWKGADYPGANNGWLTLYLDGKEKYTQTGVDNDTLRAEAVKLGAVTGNDDGTRGSYYFDSFKSLPTGTVGLAPNGSTPSIFQDGFETGNYLAWSSYQTNGTDMVVTNTAAIVGDMGLWMESESSEPNVATEFSATTEYHARFYLDPNSTAWSGGTYVSFFYLWGDWGMESAWLDLKQLSGDYQVRASVLEDDESTHQTSLVLINDGPHAFEIEWKASTAPGAVNGSLKFWVDGVQQGNLTGLDIDDYHINKAQAGGLSFEPDEPVFYDSYAANFDHYIGLDPNAPPTPPKPDDIFADNFESGDFSAWSLSTTDGGDLSVSTQAAISGTYGMKAVLDDNNKIFVTDWTPFQETRYRARFYFDPNTITMASGNAHYLLYALNWSNVVVARVELRRYNSSYQVRAAVVNDSTTWSSTTWTTISDAPHKLEIDWVAATAAGANNGGITFWVDGVQKGTYTNIDNDTRRVDYIKLGAVDGIDTGTRGAYYFDAFASRRVTYIGMRRPGSVELGMAEPGLDSTQMPDSLNAAPKSLAAPAPVRQITRVIEGAPEMTGVKPLANPLSTKLAEESPLVTTTVVISYTYDPLNRLTAADYDDGTYFHYTYDAVGNQMVEETNGLTKEYDYDEANRLVEANGVEYLWDDNGNLLSDGVYTYTYDAANRLVGVSGAGLAVSYSYNGLGDRLSETVNEQTTQYTMDLNAGLTQALQDGSNTYLYGAGRIAQYGSSGAEYFLGDALGSVRQLVDAEGNLTLGRRYKPYGEVLAKAGEAVTSYGFTNEWTDSSTGDVYLRARWYKPGQGRFLTKDTWAGNYSRPMSFNEWLYTYANPINHIDPYGKFSLDIDLDIPAWMAVLAAKTVYSKIGPIKFCLSHPDDGQFSSDTVDDLFTDFICEYGPSNRKFSGYDHLTLELASTYTIHSLRWKFYNGWIDPGINTYSFGNAEFVLATIDTIQEGDEVYIDIPRLNIPVNITHFLGSFDYKIEESDGSRIMFQVNNKTTLESGTRIPPILGGVDSFEENALSIEEIIWQNPMLANKSVSELINDYPVISVLESKKRGQTSLLEGGGTMEQTFTWFERYDPCLMRYPWPAVLEFLVIDRTMY